ncbi:BRLZ domain containing protein [Pyrenophora tritici-repentis]|nr:BRLZ domain containing protein [Pyrenophora tritici-repentis]
MSSPPMKGAAELGAAPLNFIYACSVCFASFADVYEGHHETVQGLSDGINPKNRLVTRIFLASCCHVFCSSHLEGGGPPFHPARQQPKAPCPICIKEKGDSTERDLYSIRGFHKDEYDPHIPPSWFTAPPIRLDGSGKEMEALRFQYIALIRYCQNTHAARKPLQDALTAVETKLASMQDLASGEHAKVLSLQQENERLRAQNKQSEAMKAELQRLRDLEQEMERFRCLHVNPRDLETFIENKTAIRHYLKLVPKLLDQNEQMQKRLAKLGFAMALEPISKFTGIDPHALDSDEDYPGEGNDDSAALLRKTASSHTVGRSVHMSGRPGTASSHTFFHRPLKRQRLDSPLPNKMQIDHPASREAMPPPLKPLSRMNSVRKMFPSLRKKFSNGRAAPVMENISESTSDIRMYADEHSQDNTFNQQQQSRDNRRSETPYMSGGLPIQQPSRGSERRGSQLLSSVGIHDNRSDFTFRASSPIKMDRQNNNRGSQLPTEPSYIRLMDGLSSDNGVELGLKDPREDMAVEYQQDGGSRQVMRNGWDEQDLQEAGYQRRWDLGHPFMHQLPHEPSTSADIHQQHAGQHQTNRHTNRTYNQSLGPATPAPRRQQSPGRQMESVAVPLVPASIGHKGPGWESPSPIGMNPGASMGFRSLIRRSTQGMSLLKQVIGAE